MRLVDLIECLWQFYKKPYNPILGEVLESFVKSPDSGHTWGVLEQVSHNPPVSAMFCRNDGARMQATGSATFAVSFGGNSASVTVNVPLVLSIESIDETYTTDTSLPDLTCMFYLYLCFLDKLILSF